MQVENHNQPLAARVQVSVAALAAQQQTAINPSKSAFFLEAIFKKLHAN
jgi:hypothetical protein